MKRQMALLFFWMITTFTVTSYADSSNCRTTHFKSIEELISVVIDSGYNEVNLIKSGYTAATLSVYYKESNGNLRHIEFDPKSIEKNDGLWVRVPEFDYDEGPASVNFSCGYGNVNYKLAYKVGNSALCFLHNPKGSVLNRKGKLENCLIIPYDITEVLDKVKQTHRNMFE